MKLAVTIIGAVLVATTTKFGSEAIRIDNWRPDFEPSFKFARLTDIVFPESGLRPAIDPVSEEDIAASLAALRMPEGPPPPPPDVNIDAVCHTLASAAQAQGLPTGFFARLIWQESRFQQRVVSHAGAQGVAQFMPAVAASRGLQNPFDPLAALPHSARFLREHFEYFGNLGLAAAAYNAGARRVTDWLARRGPLPQETRDYVKIITGHAPERWTEENEIELPVTLPSRAPCEGVADLAYNAGPAKVAVQLEPPVAKIVQEARIAAAKAEAEAKARRLAAAKAKRGKLLAKGGRAKAVLSAAKAAPKPVKSAPKIADRAPTDRSPAKAERKIKVAETKR